MLKIKDLHVEAEGTEILRGVNLEINPGEIHAIMGPNGGGKSTLAKVVAGHPSYEVTKGSIEYDGEDILEMEPDERARKGIFMAFQYPVEIPGVSNSMLMRESCNEIRKERGEEEMDPLEFEDYIHDKLKTVKMDAKYLERNVNAGFSGGEKKRNEILQMASLEPRLALLDETDSGLDIDALRHVSDGINQMADGERAIMLVTHYQRILNYIEPTYVHVLVNGKVKKSGGKELAMKLEEHGYDWVSEESTEVNGEAS